MILSTHAMLKELQTHCVKNFNYIPEKKKKDVWKTPREFVADGGGDCEDYAVYAYSQLKDVYGVDPGSLCLARVRTGDEYRQAHIVLIATCGDGSEYILDNRMLTPIPLEDMHADYLGDWQMLLVWTFDEKGICIKDKFHAGIYPPKWKALMSRLY